MAPLPILKVSHEPSAEDLVRLYHRAILHFTRHLGEEVALDAGTAFANPEMGRVDDANVLLDAAVPEGEPVEAAMREVEEHFRSAGARCRSVLPNPAAPAARTEPLVAHLLSAGWRRDAADILHLSGAPRSAIHEVAGLTVVPARASFRHTRALAEECAAEAGEPQLADAIMAHLDDPHWDALLALKDGAGVATVGVLAVGDVGTIDSLYVAKDHRRQGVGRTMMGRALEICARSLFRNVMLSVPPENEAAQALYRGLGFRKVGEVVSYGAP
jgi:ribosomal protein S18 acetylase RimI-like enzyme